MWSVMAFLVSVGAFQTHSLLSHPFVLTKAQLGYLLPFHFFTQMFLYCSG